MTVNRNAVLVTGGAGYIGSHVCKSLWDAGYLPVTYDNLSRGFRWAVKWGPFEEGGLGDSEKIGRILDIYSPIGVIHLAGYTYVGESVEYPQMYHTNNVEGSRALVDLVARKGRGRIPIVFSSTCSVYGDHGNTPLSEDLPTRPMNPYAVGKLSVETILGSAREHTGMPFMALRYFNACGADPLAEIGEAHDPETHLIPLTLEVAAGLRTEIAVFGTNLDTPDGSCIRDYVHVSDLANAHVSALEYLLAGGVPRAVNLGTGHGYSVFNVIATVQAVTGKEVCIRRADARDGDSAVLVGDARLAKTILNWSPRYSDLDVQIAHAWAWFKSLHGLA